MPIRVWHWLLVMSVCGGWLLGEYRSFTLMQYHFYAGYVTGCLLVVRIGLGLFGPTVLRFQSLVFSPSRILDYIRNMGVRAPSGAPGHNPLGALSVIAILLFLSVQVITGLFSEDDALFFEGPLAEYVSESVQLKLIAIHNYGASILLFLVGLHVAAILFYLLWKQENLIKAMVTGEKLVRKR